MGLGRAAVLALGSSLGLAAAALPARADVVTVYVYDFDFSVNQPDGPVVDAVVNVGDFVRWYALSEFHNTVACVGQAEFWESQLFPFPGDDFMYQFTIPGTYTYYCAPHGSDNGDGTASGMTGTVTVLPGPSGAAVLGLAGIAAGRRRSR